MHINQRYSNGNISSVGYMYWNITEVKEFLYKTVSRH